MEKKHYDDEWEEKLHDMSRMQALRETCTHVRNLNAKDKKAFGKLGLKGEKFNQWLFMTCMIPETQFFAWSFQYGEKISSNKIGK
ncbi:hypothetical protein [Helicobacter bilis]|uniref:hypothetical protein n=1 Tax=Helicobacter bilis TaxID=37372 RepID=UPI00248DCF3D|nr:hypothetical protein [Helicobacter bilis]